MKYIVGTLVLALTALALYHVFTKDGTDERNHSDREDGARSYTADGSNGAGATIEPATTEPATTEPEDVEGTGVVADGDTAGGGDSGVKVEQPGTTTPKITGPGVIKDDPLADVVFGVLRDVIRGEIPSEKRGVAEARLEAILEQEKMGTEELRQQAVVVAVSTMFRQLDQFGVVSNELTDFQILAVKAQSNEFAIDFYKRLPMEGQAGGHTGTLRSAVDVELPDGYQLLKWEVLGGFEYEEGMALPKTVRELTGKKVGIAGYMMTLEEVEDIHEFLLVESLWSCCFGTPPEVHQVLVVNVPDDRGVEFTTAPVLILGDIDVGEEVEDGFVTSVYRVKTDKVKEVE
ncbi:MAG: DUF3299 domain-containing protein [Planctomycetes bacterium]|nr:DUF3299 domain-containing protein [Planctomycetota bacterium]